MDNMLPPGERGMDGRLYLLGTDEQGRDMLSAIFYGLRLSLFVGITATVIALGVGTTVGIVAAYFGGRVDTTLMRLVDIQLSVSGDPDRADPAGDPRQGRRQGDHRAGLGAMGLFARTIRGSALAERRREYIEAAQCLALPQSRIIFRHLLPNVPPLVVVATVQVAHAIALEATLSFLGVGVPITEPSLGLLIANGYGYMLSGKYWVAFYPGVALLIAIVAINLVGDQLRDVMNPRPQALTYGPRGRRTEGPFLHPRRRREGGRRRVVFGLAARCSAWSARVGLGQDRHRPVVLGLVDPPGRIVEGSIRFQGEELTGRSEEEARGARPARRDDLPGPDDDAQPVLRVDTR